MKNIELKLQTKITILIVVVLSISIANITYLMIELAKYTVQDKIEVDITNVAKMIAQAPSIERALVEKDPEGLIQYYVKNVLAVLEEVEIIVVADMDGIRYAHPNPQNIGQRFVGGDEKRVIEYGETYVSQATGTLGASVRAFVPVFYEGRQIGFVMTGTLIKSLEKEKKQAIFGIVYASSVGLIIGMAGAFLLAQNVKKSIFGLEPHQIGRLYTEKQAMLDAIHEGIIAIDSNSNITLINDSAINMLNVDEKEVYGKNVLEVFPTSHLAEVMNSGKSEYDDEQVINDTVILTNRMPIKRGDEIVGAIATFRDKTEVTRLAEEITGVRQIIEALRANTHEFMNKLHVIMGLIQMDDVEEAKFYIMDITQNQQQIMSFIIKKVKDPTIAALLLGKFSEANERGIQIQIDESTNIEKDHGNINSNMLVTIIGNLVENAMDAISLDRSDKYEKSIDIRMEETENSIEIDIADTGMGIKKDHLDKIFQRGYTTKEGNSGIGLALVKKAVESMGGKLDVSSYDGIGTEFIIKLPKQGGRRI
ncbi:two-component system, CitB family, sensor histidine kinase DctS [Peptoclostridium litorale DSM 5388]|uniref:histidine kinase n=1 Tax=Peptoclostridium litorale DSM 5388 TaxID=1121324 RepID=A0A069RE14_PEPLI|nr:DcuS/MalK family sensor histidine kinase [Peptoclostridium litorale]KDR94440.1 sensor protein CitS [Peptoclostridium litorale DSM 5388]SIO23863.1 two-component system, CitB family, sensor histidine kinase DctS [Peptoclostridium litorale DSM 5388]